MIQTVDFRECIEVVHHENVDGTIESMFSIEIGLVCHESLLVATGILLWHFRDHGIPGRSMEQVNGLIEHVSGAMLVHEAYVRHLREGICEMVETV